jgi:hypothetical protein
MRDQGISLRSGGALRKLFLCRDGGLFDAIREMPAAVVVWETPPAAGTPLCRLPCIWSVRPVSVAPLLEQA